MKQAIAVKNAIFILFNLPVSYSQSYVLQIHFFVQFQHDEIIKKACHSINSNKLLATLSAFMKNINRRSKNAYLPSPNVRCTSKSTYMCTSQVEVSQKLYLSNVTR